MTTRDEASVVARLVLRGDDRGRGRPVTKVVRKVVDRPECRIVCVVDAGRTLPGFLPVADLADAAFVYVMPEVSLQPASDLAHGGEFAGGRHWRTSGAVIRPLCLPISPSVSLHAAR